MCCTAAWYIFHAQMRALVLSLATSFLAKSGCFNIRDSSLVVYCLQSRRLPYIFLLRSYFSPFPPFWGTFSCQALSSVSLKQFYGVPQKHAFVKLPQSIIQRTVSEARNVFFCLALRCYLSSSKMQLAPSTSPKLFCLEQRELRKSREATHINNCVWNQLI